MAKGVILLSEMKREKGNVVINENLVKTGTDNTTFLNVPAIVIKAGTPVATSSVPAKAGDIYVDTTNSKVYIAKAAAVAADYLILN
jgi:hypothetical protein